MSIISFGLWVIVGGIVVLTCEVNCLRGSALVAELKAKAKAALLNPTEVIPVQELLGVDGDDALNVTLTNSTDAANKTRSLLTGIPQKDYIYDPNLPRELNGYNLSSYPFYNGVPEDIDFKCDDLHDGFYASVPHKCQVYHHCLFGTRYDFLCANYTAFDQRTFICHFVSEVDCDNSPKFFQRNEALYKAATTPTPIPQTPRQTTLPPTTTTEQTITQRPRRRRPYRRRRPVYEYYYDDQYDDEEYYDDDPPPPRRKMNRKHRPQGGYRDEGADYFDGRRDSSRDERLGPESFKGEDSRGEGSRGEGRSGGSGDSSQESKATLRISGPAAGTVYDRPRVPPKIRRPVPLHERDKYDYIPRSSDGISTPIQTSTKNKQQHEEEDDEYYDEDYEDDYVKLPPKRGKTGSEYSMQSNVKSESRRVHNRQKSRQQPRRRPDRFEDEYEDDRPSRPSKRPRHEETSQSGRGNRGVYRSYSREEPNPVPADRPGFISSGRFASANRKRADDDRSQTSIKKQHSRVVYDDEEEEDEYYDDDEDDDIHEDGGNIRNPTHSSNGRRSDNDEPDRRKQTNPSRKQTSEFKSNNPSSRSEERPQSNVRVQGGFLRSENRKLLSSKQKPEDPSFRRSDKEEQCRNDCEDEYSEDLSSDLKQVQRNTSSQDNTDRQASEHVIQSQVSERDRLFSSRFRDNQKESKIKQQNYDLLSRTSTTQPNLGTSTQYSEPLQRYKPSIRTKQTSEESPANLKTTTTSSYSLEDYSDESLTSRYSNFRSKGRITPPNPLINNYKPETTTGNIYETAELPNSSPKTELKTIGSNDSEYSTADKPLHSPRLFSSARRAFKQSTESAITTEMAVTPTTSDSKTYGFPQRQQSIVYEENDRSVKKPISTSQHYRRIKPEPSQNENIEYYQPTVLSTGNSVRKPSKLHETTLEETPFSRDTNLETSSVDITKAGKPSTGNKSQLGSPNYGGVYRRVKISAISNPVTELEVSTTSYENPLSVDEFPNLNPNVNINKRPYVVVRPLINNPVIVDNNSKNILPPNTSFRRPIKQRVQDTDVPITSEDYNSPSINEGFSGKHSIPDPNIDSSKLRENYGYFPSKKGKIRIDDDSTRGLVQYPKQIPLNEENQYAKYLPKIEITAPGPSAPDLDIATVKSNYNNVPASFSLDIPDEEYDVTLNDALQPSTLHPTRSLVDYQQTRLKPREYQSNTGRNSEYINRGRVSYLLSAASQQVQSVLAPEASRELKKDIEEYEEVALTSAGDNWTTQHRNRPTEMFW